jgi:DNA repair protein RadA/Sms
MDFAKGEGIAVILVGHVTKDGSIAGPKTLEHLVDAVVSVEGERYAALRLVRAAKNRFGSTEEVGVFEMAGHGLLEVADPARAFLADHPEPAPGSVIAPTLEGSRPLLVEVQALVASTDTPIPRRAASGLDGARLALLLAVLEERAGVRLARTDVYASVAGGVRVAEPGVDLAVALAVAGACAHRALPADTVVVGEIGLGGEVRQIAQAERRLAEAARLGFRRVIGPRSMPRVDHMERASVSTLADALALAYGDGAVRAA